jgi:8-oxo-dGTP diphosphatase
MGENGARPQGGTPQPERHRVLVAVHVSLERDGAIVLLRRANTGFMDGFLSLPSGHLEAGESLLAAAVREVLEETGVLVREDDLEQHALMHRRYPTREYLHVFFRATTWEGNPSNAEPRKCDGIGMYSRGRLPEDMVAYERQALEAPKGSVFAFGFD